MTVTIAIIVGICIGFFGASIVLVLLMRNAVKSSSIKTEEYNKRILHFLERKCDTLGDISETLENIEGAMIGILGNLGD